MDFTVRSLLHQIHTVLCAYVSSQSCILLWKTLWINFLKWKVKTKQTKMQMSCTSLYQHHSHSEWWRNSSCFDFSAGYLNLNVKSKHTHSQIHRWR